MKNKESSSIKLIKSHDYPTYQLYAQMLNKNIDLQDGLKFAALTTLLWVKSRLPDEYIDCISFTDEDDYKKLTNNQFTTIHIDDAFKIDTIADLDNGIWAINILEPDLGALDSGIEPVTGRMIETDIAFRIFKNQLECGFKTTIHDLPGSKKAKCIRFKIIKDFCKDQRFGLKQIVDIYRRKNFLYNENSIKKELALANNPNNQLPLFIFTYGDSIINKINNPLQANSMLTPFTDLKKDDGQLPTLDNTEVKAKKQLIDDLIFRQYGSCLCSVVNEKQFENFKKIFNVPEMKPWQLLVIEPKCFGGKKTIYDYNENNSKSIIDLARNYSREKEVNFSNVMFFKQAREVVIKNKRKNNEELLGKYDLLKENAESLKRQQEREERINNYSPDEKIKQLNEAKDQLNSQLHEERKKSLTLSKKVEAFENEREKIQIKSDYLDRKADRPKYHDEIDKWCENHFKDQIVLHEKAIKLLNDERAKIVSVDRICDAIDYLATIYYETHFHSMTLDYAKDICGLCYKCVYLINPTSYQKTDRAERKIKYYDDNVTKQERPLDMHLKNGGSHDDDLLRIYFIHDDLNKKIVIGSLPNHL